MRAVTRACALPVGLALCVASAHAKIWIVDQGGQGDFTEIQPAIDAARDGDVVLVRDGEYAGFSSSKGVVVRAAATSFVATSAVTISNVAPAAVAGLSGMTLRDAELSVHDCDGEVVLERITMPSSDPTEHRVEIDGCRNVSLSTMVATGFITSSAMPRPGMSIRDSSVRLTDVTLQGASGYTLPDNNGSDGGDALLLVNSFAILAHPDLSGGDGGKAPCPPTTDDVHGGNGGDGVELQSSSLLVIGFGQVPDRINGADGGDGGIGCHVGQTFGGDGGDGIRADQASQATVSRAQLLGGSGGAGSSGSGSNGEPSSGNVSRFDFLPVLDMSADLHPSQSLRLTMESTDSGLALLVVAGRGGFGDALGSHGPPLCVLPGSWFFVFVLGQITDSLVLDLPLPGDPVIIGMPINAQAIVRGYHLGDVFTNSLVRVVGG